MAHLTGGYARSGYGRKHGGFGGGDRRASGVLRGVEARRRRPPRARQILGSLGSTHPRSRIVAQGGSGVAMEWPCARDPGGRTGEVLQLRPFLSTGGGRRLPRARQALVRSQARPLVRRAAGTRQIQWKPRGRSEEWVRTPRPTQRRHDGNLPGRPSGRIRRTPGFPGPRRRTASPDPSTGALRP